VKMIKKIIMGKPNKFATGTASKGTSKQTLGAASKGMGKHTLRNIRDGDNRQMYIRSSVLNKMFGTWTTENAAMPIEKDEDPALYSAIIAYEAKAEEALMEEGDASTGTIIKVRPTYDDEKGIAWFKLAQDFEAFNWKGEAIPEPFQFGEGSYQLVIRATIMYCGDHGGKPYQHSVMFRVSQLRYKEAKSVPMFEFEESSDEDDGDAITDAKKMKKSIEL